MLVNGRLIVEEYFVKRAGHVGIAAARKQFDAWLAEASAGEWATPAEVKRQFALASIIGGNRLVFNISGNRFRLVAAVNYRFGVIDIRFFGTHAEYDRIDVGTI
ncbi:MAG: type II toxin-antitoxin system HigB family toxin [Dongiaceae bacterium]